MNTWKKVQGKDNYGNNHGSVKLGHREYRWMLEYRWMFLERYFRSYSYVNSSDKISLWLIFTRWTQWARVPPHPLSGAPSFPIVHNVVCVCSLPPWSECSGVHITLYFWICNTSHHRGKQNRKMLKRTWREKKTGDFVRSFKLFLLS